MATPEVQDFILTYRSTLASDVWRTSMRCRASSSPATGCVPDEGRIGSAPDDWVDTVSSLAVLHRDSPAGLELCLERVIGSADAENGGSKTH